jgi:hypothetical protein
MSYEIACNDENHPDIIFLHDIIVSILCEYIFDFGEPDDVCSNMIKVLNVDANKYEHLYTIYTHPNICSKHAKYVHIDVPFNDIIYNWSSKITHISFGINYVLEINIWPATVKYIDIISRYTGPLYNIPDSLVSICVNYDYFYLYDLIKMVRDKVIIYPLAPNFNKIIINQTLDHAIRPRTIHPSSSKFICNINSHNIIPTLHKQLIYVPKYTKYHESRYYKLLQYHNKSRKISWYSVTQHHCRHYINLPKVIVRVRE